ncbi:MAG: hypothetical protein JO334_03225 [Verrucomicrobia bacterium]|nr:hypothetical protein [Verrucomicrobiota bacterium]
MITNASSRKAEGEKLFCPELLDEDALGSLDSVERADEFDENRQKKRGEDWHSFQTS